MTGALRTTQPDTGSLRLAILLPTLRGGGAERNLLRLASGLIELGHHVTVLVADERGPLRDQVPPEADFVDLGAKVLAWSVIGFSRWLRNHDVDVVIAAVNGANVVALAGRTFTRRDVPVIVSERNTLSAWRADSWSPERRWIIPWLVRRLYPKADAIVAVSQATADDLSGATGIQRDRIDVVANPVVGRALFEAAAQPLVSVGGPVSASGGDQTEQLADWMRQGSTVVTVGRLVSQKDHATLLAAFAKVQRERRDARLVIVGDGPLRNQVIDRVRELEVSEQVWLTGFVTNPYPIVAAANVVVLTSRFEGLPTVLIEALALGRAVVATDAPGGSREVLAGGRWGDLVPVGDIDAVADAITGALGAQSAKPLLSPSWQPMVAGPDERDWREHVPVAAQRYLDDAVVDAWMNVITRVHGDQPRRR